MKLPLPLLPGAIETFNQSASLRPVQKQSLKGVVTVTVPEERLNASNNRLGGDTVVATFTVINTGDRAGADVPQLYLTDAAGDKRMRLLGFERVELQPGESRHLSLTADPRLLARFDGSADQWHIAAGRYTVALGKNAEDHVLTAEVSLSERNFGP